MILTNDQYYALGKLERWYRKANHQIIDICGIIGTGIYDIIQKFLDDFEFDPKEVMYLSYNQKQVVEMAAKCQHTYYVDGAIYKYSRKVNFNSLSVINPLATTLDYKWKKEIRKSIKGFYKIIIVLDASLMDQNTLNDLMTFGLPIILIRDPWLIPSPNSYALNRDPNLLLQDLHPDLLKNPIVYFANRIIHNDPLIPGNYDIVSVVPRKQMNLYNLRTSDMIITMNNDSRNEINQLYRNKIMHLNTNQNVPNERMIVMETLYGHRLVNEDEKNIKVYLTKGTIGTLSKCNKHAMITQYVPIEFKPEFYYESFDELIMDRYYLNGVNTPSRQQTPDECVKLQYAYALTPDLARLSHWDKVTIIADENSNVDSIQYQSMIYTAITRARNRMTIIV